MRYIDLIYTEGALDRFLQRTKIVQSIRNTLAGEGYVEIEGPTLHSIAGGAASSAQLTSDGALIYQGAFNTEDWSGDVIATALSVSASTATGNADGMVLVGDSARIQGSTASGNAESGVSADGDSDAISTFHPARSA